MLALQALQVRGGGCAALSKEEDEAVARMRAVYDKRRKLMVELIREDRTARRQLGMESCRRAVSGIGRFSWW